MADVLSKINLYSPSYSSPRSSSPSSSPITGSPFLRLKSASFNGDDVHTHKLIQENIVGRESRRGNLQISPAQNRLQIGKAKKWWEKNIEPNMKEISSAEDLADSLLKAGDKLVIVDFFSPGCGGCRALHPKMCQIAEMNKDIQFLQVNYEDQKSMCYTLNVHVLPFFRFYRGAHGRLCSFSCTNATIKKFKDAIAKHTTERCSLGPTKGLEESELLALSANKDLPFNYTPNNQQEEKKMTTTTTNDHENLNLLLPSSSIVITDAEENILRTDR